jgi:hypothetical protein
MTMAQAQPPDISVPSRVTSSGAPKGSPWTGLLQVLSNRYERKSAATVALVFFVGSIALAPALIRDQKKLAAEINTKTLKAAAAIKAPPRPMRRVKH